MDRGGKFITKKSLGQHFLNNPRIPKRMADAAGVREGDTVVEIGPGTGALTKELLARGASVIALEADTRAIEVLEQEYGVEINSKKLVILHTDAREFDPKTLNLTQGGYKVVSNIPYYLSGFLFRTLLEASAQPSILVFLVQREVAERIARDKKGSILSLSVRVFGDPHYITTVAPGNFTPPPKVDSAIIAVDSISRDRLEGIPQDHFFTIIHAGFSSKRKQLLGNLTKIAPREGLVSLFATLEIPLAVRGEDLPLPIWLALARGIPPCDHKVG